MEISEFQKLMKEKIGVEDSEMGSLFLFSVLVEEIGELAKAVRCKNEELIGDACMHLASRNIRTS